MAPLLAWTTAALLALTAGAHYTLDYPETIGFDEDKEDTGPCGGFSPDGSSKVTDFHVGGDNVAITLLHPQGTWLYRATLDMTAQGNWSVLFPQVQQSGLGKFCEPMIPVNPSWAGQKGVLNVVVKTQDGILYQCAVVNFVSGVASSNQQACTNGSLQAAFNNDPALQPLVTSSSGTTGPSPTGSGNGGGSGGGSGSQSPSQSPTKSPNAAPGPVGEMMPLGSLLVVAAMALLGSAFVL